MAFQFPNPAVTPEFTGANGITYSWDATDSKWVVKSFSDADDIFYQEDPPTLVENPNLAEGDLWVDSDDNKMYVWSGSVWSEVTACGGASQDARPQIPAVVPHEMVKVGSGDDLDNGKFLYSTTNKLYYSNSALGVVVPDLKVGDQFKAVKSDGTVFVLEVTVATTTQNNGVKVSTAVNKTPGVTLANGEAYDVNFVFY